MNIIMLAAVWAMAPVGRVPISPTDSVQPDSRVWITGSSTIRRFTCRAKTVSGHVALRAEATRETILAGRNAADAPSLTVPFAQLDCGIGAMNRHLREAVQAVRYPNVSFRLDRYAATVAGEVPTVHLVGSLAIAGVERPIVLDARLAADTLGVMHVRGVYVVQLTDFGIEPPRRFGGLLTVRNRVAVHFDVVAEHEDVAPVPVVRP
jgi:polyisoprenoid-binding protein YceI